MKLLQVWPAVCCALLCLLYCNVVAAADDFYTLLDLDKSATTKDIRKAFKKAALKMHPDKNPDDPDADSKFMRYNRAYEVLKDDDLRKKYDQFGEEGLEENQSGRGYHSWSYYRDNFGIYDDDPEIITLSRTDFEASVTSSNTPWFINYYHPNCGHCHTLAPDWRWLSIELQGVVRIGAVNCDDEFHLCSEQGIRSYPTLLAYPGRDHFRLEKSRDNLVSFILGRLPTGLGIPLTTGMLYNMKQQHLQLVQQQKKRQQQEQQQPEAASTQPWLLAVFHSTEQLADYRITLMKLAAIFSGVLKVGRLDCTLDGKACKSLNMTSSSREEEGTSPLYYYPGPPILGHSTPVLAETAQEAAKEVLALLPQLPLISAQEFQVRHDEMVQRRSQHNGWLVQFCSENDATDDEFRKVLGLTAPLPTHRVLCPSLPDLDCDLLYLHKTPAFVLFKPGGGYEIHHGRLLAQDIANFAREAASAPNFRTLTPKEFPSVLSHKSHWFIDFYAPWCPPCMRLLPQFRKASVMMQQQQQAVDHGHTINFGILDCTTHGSLCSQFNVNRYPTTILYNNTTPHQYSGHHNPANIVEFVKDTLNPTVIVLTERNFASLVLSRDASVVWVVDFFASWCGPCQDMAPEYRKFSRQMSGRANVMIGSVDCAAQRDLCQDQGVRSYPTIRLYRQSAKPRDFSTYNDYSRNAESFKRWLYSHLPSSVVVINDRTFQDVLRSEEPWLLDFYAPWCGHCHQFAPEFEDLAKSLEGEVKLGKVDCDAHPYLCQGAGIRAYPTVVLYKGASTQEGRVGSKARERLQQPVGETLDSLQTQAILSHVRWRLHQHKQNNKLPRDEL